MRAGRGRRVDIIDETYIAASPELVATIVKDARNHRLWWPHLRLSVLRDRGARGMEWTIAGQLDGTMEIWVEPWWEGAILHCYVRGAVTATSSSRLEERHLSRWKASVTRLKDTLEGRGRSWSGVASE